MNTIIARNDRYNGLRYPVGGTPARDIREFATSASAEIAKLFPGRNVYLICRGSSGTILATAIQMMLSTNECYIWHIKKEGEVSHGDSDRPRRMEKAVNIVVDDFISSGETIRAIVGVVREMIPAAVLDCCVLSFSNDDPKNELLVEQGFQNFISIQS